MGTRAIIKFEGSDIVVYKHYDGYPRHQSSKGTYRWLSEFNMDFAKNRGDDPGYKVAQLLRDTIRKADEYPGLDPSLYTGWGVYVNKEGDDFDMWQEYEYILYKNGKVKVYETWNSDGKVKRRVKHISEPKQEEVEV